MDVNFRLTAMNATQLAMLYKFLVSMYREDEANEVYAAAMANCGEKDFCRELAMLK